MGFRWGDQSGRLIMSNAWARNAGRVSNKIVQMAHIWFEPNVCFSCARSFVIQMFSYMALRCGDVLKCGLAWEGQFCNLSSLLETRLSSGLFELNQLVSESFL